MYIKLVIFNDFLMTENNMFIQEVNIFFFFLIIYFVNKLIVIHNISHFHTQHSIKMLNDYTNLILIYYIHTHT